MSLFMFGEVLDVLERFAAFLAAILVGRHGSPPARVLQVIVVQENDLIGRRLARNTAPPASD
jgi:hypothetical protein